MATKHVQKYSNTPRPPVRHMSSTEFRAITFVTTLVLAGITIVLGIKEPVVWGFLGTAIGISLGQPR